MIYNIRNFVLTCVTVVIFSSYSFAPWTSQPEPPPVGTINTCFNWLIYHNFEGPVEEDRARMRSRDTQYDEDVSYFAAGYAYLLSNSIIEIPGAFEYERSEFCSVHTMNYINHPYITLKEAEFTCEGWIDFYINDQSRFYHFNYNWAMLRDKSMDNKISLWAALYFQHITSNNLNAKRTPRGFCILMGKPVTTVPLTMDYPFLTIDGSKMSCTEWNEVRKKFIMKENVFAEENSKHLTKLPFTSLDTKMSCYEWIKRWGFSNDNSRNLQIAESVDINSVNHFTKNYITYVKYISKEYIYHFEYPNLRHLIDSLLTPKDYCEIVMNLPETKEINYFGNM